MRFGLGLRLFLGILLVLTVGEGISSMLVDRNVRQGASAQVRDRLTYEVIMLGQMTANALFGPIDPTDTSLSGVVKQLADAVHTNLSILAADGTVVADSDVADLSKVDKEGASPEVVEALASGTGVSVRAARGEPRMFVAQTIAREGKVLGIARASVPVATVDAIARGVRTQMAYGGLAAAAAALVIATIITLGILLPIKKLAEGARRIGDGDLAHRIDVGSSDEIGDLARAFNDMIGRLQAIVGALDRRNKDTRIVLDNVAQGLVTVAKDGTIAEERSRALDSWFRAPQPGVLLWEVFGDASPGVRGALALGWEQLFEGILPLELALSQLPRRVKCGAAYYELVFEPILGEGPSASELDKCLVVVSDVTAVVAAEHAEAEQREQMTLFAAVARDRDGVADFLKGTGDVVDYVTKNATDPERLVDVTRGIHTIKGNAGLFGLTNLSSLCHEIETRMAEGDPDEGLSVADRDALRAAWDSLVRRTDDLLGELRAGGLDVSANDVQELVASIRLGTQPDTLIKSIATWSLDPVDRRLKRLAEQARQLAPRIGKAGVTVDIEPTRLRVPAERWAPFFGNLVHVMRNALDHGIESPEERAKAGKPPHGRLLMSAVETGEHIVIELADDGRGINWARLREKAAGLGAPAATEADLIAALFTDGISTRDEVSEISGRGVGLGAVRAACESMGGRIEVESAIGIGTTFRFRFPLSGLADALPRVSIAPRSGATVSRAPRALHADAEE
jgi:two-component system chemotaxis sensor kinase CheA